MDLQKQFNEMLEQIYLYEEVTQELKEIEFECDNIYDLHETGFEFIENYKPEVIVKKEKVIIDVKEKRKSYIFNKKQQKRFRKKVLKNTYGFCKKARLKRVLVTGGFTGNYMLEYWQLIPDRRKEVTKDDIINEVMRGIINAG